MATETVQVKPATGTAKTQAASQATKTLSAEFFAEQEALEKRLLEEGARRIRRSCERAMAMGIIDKEGNLLKKELPPDMLPGADRDFGG
jgi:hypothetical protein